MRQNLALVVGLQGRFAEAESIAKADLPPDEAAANVAYLREMLSRKDNPRTAAKAGVAGSRARPGRLIHSKRVVAEVRRLPKPFRGRLPADG